MNLCVYTLGCRLNQCESEAIADSFSASGWNIVKEDESADLYIVNTCTVTAKAEQKARRMIRLFASRGAFVVVTGCYAQMAEAELKKISSSVMVVPLVKKAGLLKLASHISVAEEGGMSLEEALRSFTETDTDVFEYQAASFSYHSRAYLKVQDGCDNNCGYCRVHIARGHSVSLERSEVIKRALELEEAGFNEIVLTGVNLGAYDGSSANDEHVEIDELLGIILRETSIPQIRLSSIEPMDVSDRLIDRIAESKGRIAPFLHLPVQSGCTATLERMGRPYRAEEFEGLCDRIRRKVPAVALSCDIIVGFPGETEEEFEASLGLCERVGFSRMHVFRYSARPGTPAATMPDQVPPEIMAERSQRMRELAERMARIDAQSRCGTCERAVIEQGRRGTLASFHRVEVDGLDREGIEAPALVDVAIMDVNASGLVKAEFVRRSVLDNAPVASKGD